MYLLISWHEIPPSPATFAEQNKRKNKCPSILAEVIQFWPSRFATPGNFGLCYTLHIHYTHKIKATLHLSKKMPSSNTYRKKKICTICMICGKKEEKIGTIRRQIYYKLRVIESINFLFVLEHFKIRVLTIIWPSHELYIINVLWGSHELYRCMTNNWSLVSYENLLRSYIVKL